MLHLYDRATMAHARTLHLDPRLHRLLTDRIAALITEYGDLTDWTEFLVVEPRDTEDDIIRHFGFSPLVEPIDGVRFGQPGFHPHWDLIADRGGWYEIIQTFGSAFAYVLLVADRDDELGRLCRAYGRKGADRVIGGGGP